MRTGVGYLAEATLDSVTQFVYVASTGDDVRNDGSFAKPWATVERAVRGMPRKWRGNPTAPIYCIRVVAPYSGPLGILDLSDRFYTAYPNGGSVGSPLIVLQGYATANVGAVNDPRFSIVAGPLVTTAASVWAGCRGKYTLPAASFATDEALTGLLARVFRGGVEVARGWVERSTAATQEIEMTSAAAWVPAAGDTFYAGDFSVVLGGIAGGAAQTNSQVSIDAPFRFRVESVKLMDSVTLQGDEQALAVFVQTRWVANGGSGCSTLCEIAALGTASVLAGVSQDAAGIVCGPCLYRSSGGFVWGGNLSLSGGGSFAMGRWQSSTGTLVPSNGLSLATNVTWRGVFDGTASPNARIQISGGSAGAPVLLIPQGGIIAPLHLGATMAHSGVIAVDAVHSVGDVVEVQEGRLTSVQEGAIGTWVPADAGVPALAAGRVVTVVRDGTARVNTTSTLTGSGAPPNDVKAGGAVALTWAGLAALGPPVRSQDAAVLAAVLN